MDSIVFSVLIAAVFAVWYTVHLFIANRRIIRLRKQGKEIKEAPRPVEVIDWTRRN